MTRLLSTLRADARLQFRNGFYYAALFVATLWVLLLLRLPAGMLGILMPAFLLENLIINTFYFVGGLVLLEKGEGTLEALVVTPLRRREYLLSKIGTLTGLSLLENLAIVILVVGPAFNPLLLLVGIVLMAAMLTLCGFVAIARFDTINEYLFPSFVLTSLLSLPLFAQLGVWQSWLAYLHPIQAPLTLLNAAFGAPTPWELLYGAGYSLAWLALLYRWSEHSFARFIIRKEGVKG